MSLTITGVAGDFNVAAGYTKTAPADLDPLNVASVESNATTPKTDMQADANAVEFFRQFAARINVSNVFAAQQDLAGGFQDSTTPTTWQQLFVLLGGALGKTRLHYGSGKWSLSVNASFNDGTALWSSDNNAVESYRVALGGGTVQIAYHAATAGTWADGAWTSGPTNLTVGDLFASNNVTATGAVIGGTGVTATTGNVAATAGNLVATGDPASDQARLKGKQFVMSGSAPTASKGAAVSTGGDGSVTMDASSNDARGHFTATTGAALNNGSGQILTTITFNKAYPVAPEVVLYPGNVNAADLATQPYIDIPNSSTTAVIVKIGASPLAAGGTSYEWGYHVIG